MVGGPLLSSSCQVGQTSKGAASGLGSGEGFGVGGRVRAPPWCGPPRARHVMLVEHGPRRRLGRPARIGGPGRQRFLGGGEGPSWEWDTRTVLNGGMVGGGPAYFVV